MRWIYFDCDDTLVMWDREKYANLPDVRVRDPFIKDEEVYEDLKVHQHHVDWLIRMAKRGEVIVVWSAGGALWAQAVAEALGIDEHVTLFLQKPDTMFDDLSPEKNFPAPIWSEPKNVKK